MSITSMLCHLVTLLSIVLGASVIGPATASAEAKDTKGDPLDGLSFSGQWFLGYDVDTDDSSSFNEFLLKRGYVTVKKDFDSHLSARVTQDIAVDREGDGEGDIELRLKYMYLRYTADDIWVFTKPFAEFGLVHRPWLDFEQKVNPYRVQGTMFLERYKVLRSADYGVTVGTLLGGEMDEQYQREVSKSYPGRYGSIVTGVYNGGGYEAIEENKNKLVETRATVRPLPDLFPGVQISWVGGFGKGNTPSSPELTYNGVFLSLEHRHYTFTYLYYQGVGDIHGRDVDSAGTANDQDGYSVFGEIQHSPTGLALFGRYDRFDHEQTADDWFKQRYIVGLAYYFHGRSKLLIDYDHLDVNNGAISSEARFEIAIEINY